MKTFFLILAAIVTLSAGLLPSTLLADESYSFTPGANLFAYPVAPSTTYSANDLLTELNSQADVTSIQHYNSESGLFETCVWKNNTAAGANFPISMDQGYIVHTTESFVYQVTGERICPEVPLAAGLNTIAFPCAESGYDAYQLLQDLGAAAIAIKKQNPADGSVLTATLENSTVSGDNFSIEHGQGYLVYMDSETSWLPVTLPSPPSNTTGYAGDQMVILTWTAPVGDISGYNIYRSVTSGADYEKINDTPLSATEYTDPNRINGTPLYYVVSAVDIYGRETAFSTEATVTPANTGPTVIPAPSTMVSDTTWTLSGSPYSVSDSITIPSGVTLTLEPGVIVEFHTGRFDIDGVLIAKGTAEHQIVFQADDNSWTGLRFDTASSIGSILEYCHIEDASRPVAVENSSIEISHCNIFSTSSYGLYYRWSAGHIHHSTISGSSSSMQGIYLYDSSPLVEYNVLTSLGIGIYIGGDSTPQIRHNSITEFSTAGLSLSGEDETTQPYPVITGNTIKTDRGGSSTYLLKTSNYFNDPAAGIHRTVNARNNYWGTTDPQILTASVDQWQGFAASDPYVDFSSFLDRPDGSVVPGNFIFSGPLPQDKLNWTPDAGPYIVLGNALVDSGDTLTIAAGTEVQFAGGGELYGHRRDQVSSLQVLGKLTAVGTSDSFIHLLSQSNNPEKSDWYGIVFLENYASDSAVSYCKIEHAFRGITCMGGSLPISHNEIIAGNDYGDTYATGIRLEANNNSSVSNNSVSGYNYYDGSGIYIRGSSSPTVSDNSFSGNRHGIYFYSVSTLSQYSTAQITSNTVTDSIERSVYLYGSNNDATNPQPVISDNTFLMPGVASSSFYASSYGTGSSVIINARNNWWGTYDAAAIAKIVYDKTDNPSSPFVDYRFFLDTAGGSPGTGNQVLGDLGENASITWSAAASPYIVMGDLNIPATTTLTIEAGTEIWMSSGSIVNVDGALIVNGTEASPVKFSAGNMIENPSEWQGISLIGAENDATVLSYCQIEGAVTALYMEDCSPTISHCSITAASTSSYTVRLLRVNGTIEYNTITNFPGNTRSISGLYIEDSSPLIQYNTVSDMYHAVYLDGQSNPQILHNTFSDFTYTGINLYGYSGNPFPTINFNTIQTSRGDYNTWSVRCAYYNNDPLNGVFQVINARNNYWGETDPQLISSGIDQWAGGTSADPFVDYSGFLDGPEGSAVTGNFIAPGPLAAAEHWQPVNNPYILLGHTAVTNGQELIIDPGTEIRFIGGSESLFSTTRSPRSSLRVYGKLTAVGTSSSEIHFSSNHKYPTKGNWSGLFFYDNADDASIISYAKIEHAFNGVYCAGAAPEISNNKIIAGPGTASSSYLYGIRLEAESNATISNNLITGFNDTDCDGINILDSSPTISGNTIDDNYYGIYIKDGSPDISGNTVIYNYYGLYINADSNTTIKSTPAITSNTIGDSSRHTVYLNGSGNDATSPFPTFSNNSFATQYTPEPSFETAYYSSPSSVVINAENNWWGTDVQTEIDTIIYDHNDATNKPLIDYQPFLSQSPQSPLLGKLAMSSQWFSPNSDGSLDTVTISWQGSADISNWTVTIKDEANQIVRDENVGSSLSWIWDGKNASGEILADGQYTIVISGSNAGTVEREVGVVNIDVQPITNLMIHTPTAAQVMQNVFDINATVIDENLYEYTLELGQGASPTSWRTLTDGGDNMDNETIYTLESNTINEDIIPSLPTVGDLTNGEYVLRLTATDMAGNITVVTTSITLENVFITNVSTTEMYADPTLNQPAGTEFTISADADMNLQIFTELTGEPDQLVRTINQSCSSGINNFSWDGTDDFGNPVEVGGYVFVLSAVTTGALTDQFKPGATLNQIVSSTPDASFNPLANDWFSAGITMGNVPGHFQVKITPAGEDAFYLYTQYAEAQESFMFNWDGRRLDGTLVESSVAIFFTDTWSNENLFLVAPSSAHVITGPAATINIQSNPYLVNFCYGEQTSILYSLDQQAEITITLFPLDQDASSPDAIILVDQELQSAGEHSVTWTGIDDSDVRRILFSTEGLYNFVIEATVNNTNSTAVGVVSLYK